MEWLTLIAYFIIVSTTGIYLFSKWRFSYWKRRGVPSLKPVFFWGDMKSLLKGMVSEGQQIAQLYTEFKSNGLSFGGAYVSIFPRLIPTDLNLIKSILQTDFSCFVNHGIYHYGEIDPLQANLVNLENEAWKSMRTKLSPTFTSSKLLKKILELIPEKFTEN